MTDALLESFKARYPFPLDDFQLRAIEAILSGTSVIVSAPTGSGKTLVAEFAIHAALARIRRIAYTTPLKALSNQKF
ncbi:MAG TPA: DEAD/DEAH box helicase, partial [Methylomirabilota bacterium]|nr:DEAD/DEAH box helicase [Methylomirabilota bacterium]